MAVASFEGFVYWYPGGAAPALGPLDLVIESGLTLVSGPSGGGKSTLLRAFNGLVPHFHGGRVGGAARIDGLDLLRSRTSRLARSVGFVFQNPEAQFVHASVERDVAFGLENTGMAPGAMADRVAEALASVGGLALRERRIATLSGGERQRVALAGALALRPGIVVLDEPTSQLDPDGARSLLAACLGLTRSGRAVVISEQRHDQLAAAAGCRLLVEAGQVRGGIEATPQRARSARPPATGREAWRLDAVSVGPAGVARPVLERFSLAGREGEVIALMGPNGSGKTTLLRTVAGLLKARSGIVERRAGRVAYLPQDPAAMLHQPSVRAEVELTLRRSAQGSDATPYLAEMGLEGLAARYPRDLSGGERQRAAIAAVVAGRPAIALLDEPTRGMDAAARIRLTTAIERLAGQGCSVLLATHDSDLAADAADRVVRIG